MIVGYLDNQEISFEDKYNGVEPLYTFKGQNYSFDGLIRISPYYENGLTLKTKISPRK